ncbi:MAG: hypothetical protein K0R12_10 [Gammaproteobacteria bacterium]|jgi:hypothetical protein|nr:hypothetical protein [Gammaproteobacteria bacterium]
MALAKKQKIMIPLVIAAFAFLGWEAYQLLGGDSDYTVPSTPAPIARPKAPVPAVQAPNNNDEASTPGMQQPDVNNTPAATTPVSVNKPVSTKPSASAAENLPVDSTEEEDNQKAFIQAQQAREQQYIQMVNDYQLAEMQKKLADANAQLAQSKLKEAQSVAKASQQNIAVNQASTGVGAGNNPLQNYSLLYVSYIDGHWTGTLRYQGRLHNVYIGSQFADGTSVRVIDRNGVVLSYKDQSRYLTIPIPMTTSGDNTGSATTGSMIDKAKNASAASSDPEAQTSERAEDVYNTLNQIQQALPGN